MGDRYVTLARRPRGSERGDEPLLPQLTVYEADEVSVDTGLLDATGARLYRVRERLKIGFGRE